MKLDAFVTGALLDKKSETQKVIHLAFYFFQQESKIEFTAHEAAGWLEGLNFGRPNISRLRDRLIASQEAVRGTVPDSFRLHRKFLDHMGITYPALSQENEDTSQQGSILPTALFMPNRGFIESLCKQINAAYENNIFDGCAVLMRRLMEILLILSFDHLQIGSEIKGSDGNYMMLEGILDRAKVNPKLALSRNSKLAAEEFRKLGNFSAHKIHYSCRREDIKKVALEYRALFEELLYKSGLRT